MLFLVLLVALGVWAIVATCRAVVVDGRRRVRTAEIARPAGPRA